MKKNKSINFKLYLITDRNLVTHYSSLVSAVRQALQGGIRAVQLREKDLSSRDLLKLAYRMKDLTAQFGAKLFINDRFDIALAVGAEGVHLAQSSLPPDVVRKRVKKKLILGVSTHSLQEALDAERAGADFVTLGPVFRTPSKLRYGRPVGLETLKKVCSTVDIPVFAIGGVRSSRMRGLQDAGVCGVAMISEIFRANNIKNRTKELLMKMEGPEK